ncbi:MAG TPA: hypothetical protein VFM05_06970 [Candidatus Saccharimonadales bacterium]|nr:hypothetical protein [Candidatus Saccharimonadales bacterium]
MPKTRPGVEKVPVIVPTRDEQGAVARSVAVLWNVIFSRGKLPLYIHASCVGYARVRTDSFKEARKYVDKDIVRGFLLDDDMLITDEGALYDAVATADKYNWNIVAPYRTKHNRIAICDSTGSMISPEQFAQMQPYAPVPFAGLGFYYGDIPLTYEFHSDGKPFAGEDLNFFFDNPQLKPRVAPVPIKHLKVIPI